MRAPATMDDVLTAIRAATTHRGRPVVVGIDGQSAAGKSTLARRIESECGDTAAVIEGDDFYADIDWTVRASFDPADAYSRNFDWHRLHRQVLAPARNGAGSLRYQRYDWGTKSIGEWRELTTPAILVVEGVYMLRPELRNAFDIKIWVEARRGARLVRQGARHATYTAEIANSHHAMIELWEAAEIHYSETYAPSAVADMVISGEAEWLGSAVAGRQTRG